MHHWLSTAAADAGVELAILEDAEAPLLDMISAVAHGPSRPGAPLTAFLVGVAAGRGADASELAARLGALARESAPTDSSTPARSGD